ncbi:hypothetical protein U0070_025547 [Myodes glareolus]|uniref:Uncharacterized protein n=1 Tax=Myodes glareolus TaxID=447135 RepID=A0AAW0IF02_MYOGA
MRTQKVKHDSGHHRSHVCFWKGPVPVSSALPT